MMSNAKIVDFVRKIFGIVAGMLAGVLGLTGFQGFLVYGALYALVSVVMLARMGFDVQSYFMTTPLAFTFSGIGSQVLTFILFWSLTFAL
eukprot:g304.t1